MRVELKLNNGSTKIIEKSELLLNLAVNKFEDIKIIGYKMLKGTK